MRLLPFLVSPPRVHERREHIPAGWSYNRKHDNAAIIPLRFALKQSNIDAIDDYLMEVSHPESAKYGQHWTAREVFRKFLPSIETTRVVLDWLEKNGFDSSRAKLTRNRGWIEVQATVEEAERLLQTEYHVYGHETGEEHVACDSYRLPEHVQPHVDFVIPTVHFDAKITRKAHSGRGPNEEIQSQLETCDKLMTPICLRFLYGLVYEPLSADNSYGIVEYTPQAYLQTDLDMFQSLFSRDLVGVAPVMVSIDGGYAQTEDINFDYNCESNLDLEYAMNLVTAAQPITLYQAGEGASLNNFLDAIDGTYCTFDGGDGNECCGTASPTNVISTSYAYNEADLTPSYTARQCAEYAKLGLMGVTVLYGSGDYGVAGTDGYCLTPSGTYSLNGTIFNPSFPATCPYITSVGATQVNPNSTVYEPEVACEQVIYSGGGFSNYFAMPDYQKTAVEHYLTNYSPQYPPNVWNASGTRAFPDIAANGANYVVAIDGAFDLVYGTSCSSPVSGSILTMVNDARLAFGKSPIGFINPTIYSPSFAATFNDVAAGGNPGCGTAGYSAVPGWDPVTGLGTPNFPKLLAKWLLLP